MSSSLHYTLQSTGLTTPQGKPSPRPSPERFVQAGVKGEGELFEHGA